VPAAAVKFACDTYGKQNTWDSTRDTEETVQGIKVKRQAFRNIGCKL
jgi:hypothetical protein